METTENPKDARHRHRTFDWPRRGYKPKTGDAYYRLLSSVGRRNTSRHYQQEAPLAWKLLKVGRDAEMNH